DRPRIVACEAEFPATEPGPPPRPPAAVAADPAAGQGVLRRVGELQRMVVVPSPDNGDDGPEDLLLSDDGVVGHVGEHRRLYVVARAGVLGLRAARHEARVRLAVLEILKDLLVLPFAYDSGDVGVVLCWPNGQPLHARHEALEHLVVHL